MVLLTALVLSVEAIKALRPSRWAGCQGLMEWPGVPGFSGAGPSVLSQIPTPIVACCLDTCSYRHSSSHRYSLAWPGRGRLLASLGFGRATVSAYTPLHGHEPFNVLQSWASSGGVEGLDRYGILLIWGPTLGVVRLAAVALPSRSLTKVPANCQTPLWARHTY